MTQSESDSAVAAESGSGSTTRFMAGTPRKGDQPKNWSGRRYFLNLNVGGHVPGIFFNTDGIHWLSFPVPFTLLEIVVVDFHGDVFEVSSLCPTMRCWSGFVYGVRGWLI